MLPLTTTTGRLSGSVISSTFPRLRRVRTSTQAREPGLFLTMLFPPCFETINVFRIVVSQALALRRPLLPYLFNLNSFFHSDDLPQNDRKYAGVDPADLPRAESLKLTKDRFLVEWENEIAPAIKSGKRILIVAHGNTIRGLCQHLDEISDEDIVGLDIPTGVPLVFTLDKDLKPITHPEAIPPLSARYLGDVSGIRARIEAVKAQTK
ncbi:unnamed protein product [Ectocarpus sp. 6 AP-2014]